MSEVVYREASCKYRQASGQVAELQEEVVEALQTIGLVLADIKEALCSNQLTRHRGMQNNELRKGMAYVDRRLLVTSNLGPQQDRGT